MGGRRANTPETLWSKVDKRGPDECWPWKGFRNPQGYGRTWISDKGYYAHRVIFDLANEGIIDRSAPDDRFAHGYIMHTCDNPPCCNPNHLKVCTHAENVADKVAKGRQHTFSSVSSPNAKFSEDDVHHIRYLKRTGATKNAIALLYEVSISCIGHCLYGLSYQDIH
jgi:hypothetical protein